MEKCAVAAGETRDEWGDGNAVRTQVCRSMSSGAGRRRRRLESIDRIIARKNGIGERSGPARRVDAGSLGNEAGKFGAERPPAVLGGSAHKRRRRERTQERGG